MKKIIFTTAFLLLLTLISLSSYAQQRAFYIKGVVNYISDSDNILNNVAIGDSIAGVIRFDLSATDSNSSSEVGDYWYDTPPNGMEIMIDDYTFITDSSNVNFLCEVINNLNNSDNIVFRSYNNLFPAQLPSFTSTQISWQLDDASQSALSDTEVPQYIVLYLWTQPFGLTITGSNDDVSFLIRGNVTQLDTVSNIASVNNISYTDLHVYPNPAGNFISISSNEQLAGSSFSITDELGRVVMQGKLEGKTTTLNIEQLPQGLFMIRIGEQNQKIIKLVTN